MVENIYNFRSVYYNIKSIFDKDFQNENNKYERCCKAVSSKKSTDDESFKNYCKKGMNYLKYLEDNYTLTINKAQGSLYLYSWLYNEELHKAIYKGNELDIYKTLLEEFDQEVFTNFQNHYITHIKKHKIEKLIKLYDLYYKFDKFKNNLNCTDNNCECVEQCYNSYNNYIKDCNDPDNADFCNGLEEFRAQYNNYMSENSECEQEYKYLPPAINFGISVILIPIIATLIISSLLFVLYKFTPMGSWMCPRSKHKYKMKENIGEQMYGTIHRSGINNNRLIKNPYTISYHSVEHS